MIQGNFPPEETGNYDDPAPSTDLVVAADGAKTTNVDAKTTADRKEVLRRKERTTIARFKRDMAEVVVEEELLDLGGEELVLSGLNMSPFRDIDSLKRTLIGTLLRIFSPRAVEEFEEDGHYEYWKLEFRSAIKTILDTAMRNHGRDLVDLFPKGGKRSPEIA